MYRYILTPTESNVIRTMESEHDYSLLEIAVRSRLTPSEIRAVVDSLTRLSLMDISGPDSPRIKLTAKGSQIRRHLAGGALDASKLSSDVLITDEASAERIQKNLQSKHLDRDLENYISNLK